MKWTCLFAWTSKSLNILTACKRVELNVVMRTRVKPISPEVFAFPYTSQNAAMPEMTEPSAVVRTESHLIGVEFATSAINSHAPRYVPVDVCDSAIAVYLFGQLSLKQALKPIGTDGD